ncbi:WD40 repeat domain-containing protein [Ekhidna sp.]|uniref:WD40 repeat domain-containing protein n=1 Tax=Ekhidna sp. TaxID=2608089 RepID=UPI003299EDF7
MGKIEVKKLHTFLGHNDSIYTLAALDDHRFISAGGDGMIVLWDLKSPDEGEVVVKIQNSIYALCVDRVNGCLYVGQNNQGIHKIDLRTKKEVSSISLGDHQVFAIELVDDKIWVGLSNGEVVELSLDLSLIKKMKYADDRIRSIDESKEIVALGCSDNLIRIIQKSNGSVLNELNGHKNSVFATKYHPSGKYLISAGRDAHLKVWDTQSDYVLRESIAAHLYTINDVIFNASGRYFVTASMDKSIKLWDAHSFKLLKVLDKHRHAGHGNSVNKLLWMNYRDLLVTCSDDRTISVWEIKFAE